MFENMEYAVSKTDIKNYLTLPKNFDWDLVDQELGFGKIFKIIPEEVYLLIKQETGDQEKEIFRLLTKAATHYAFILAIPKIKVQISNYGIQEFNQDKVKAAAWWDIRDLGLSLLKVADKCFSDAITKIFNLEDYKILIPIFQEDNIISTPEEFEKSFSINYSPEVFLMMNSFLKQALLINISDKLKEDCINVVLENDILSKFLKEALVFYSLYYASLLPTFLFLQNSIAIQYEELPWQKSKVLSLDEKIKSGENFLKIANEHMKIIINYIKKNTSQFPCYTEPIPDMVAKARDSGVSLIG